MNAIERALQGILAFAFALAGRLIQGIVGALMAPFRSPLRVRVARADEVVDLRHAVLRVGRPRADAIWDGDTDARHWVAERDGRVVAVASVFQRPFPDAPPTPGEPPQHQLRGMAVDDALRGQGLGARLLRRVEEDVGADLWCNARVTASGFYERQGWRSVGEPFELPGIGPHYRMFKRLVDIDGPMEDE